MTEIEFLRRLIELGEAGNGIVTGWVIKDTTPEVALMVLTTIELAMDADKWLRKQKELGDE